jgi:ABC-type multidrug transport system fused ATPase/permease subunit
MEDRMIVHEVVDGVTALLIGVTISICLTQTVIFIVRTLKQRASQKSKYDLYSRLIDKFGNAPEFIAYVQSEEGRRFLEEDMTPEKASSPFNKILVSIQIGVILTLFGTGLLTLSNIWDNSLGGDLFIVLTVIGTVGLMIGIGFLITAGISYKLCRAWGLLTTKAKTQTTD